jgi:hypothetical protein
MTMRPLSNSVSIPTGFARSASGAVLMLPLLATLACSAAGQGTDFGAGGSGAGSSGSGASGTLSSGTLSGQGGGFNFDAGGDGAVSSGCQYVDLLFVTDNSVSMSDHQVALAGQFPAFVDAMISKLPPNVDLHVAMTTTDFYGGSSCSESTINCKTGQTPQEVLDHYLKPTDGDTGTNGEQGRFFQWDGKYYYATNTSNPDPGFKTWFSAAATQAGETGCSYEFMSAAAAYAAHPANDATNQGFFRDENGVLLVFILTDEPDKSMEGVQVYHDMLTAKKPNCGGDACIITAGLIDPCITNAMVGDTLWGFMNSFGEPPIYGDIEDHANYINVVGDALAQVVKQTCDEISIPH